MLFFVGIFNAYCVVFSRYLAITKKRRRKKKKNEEEEKILLILIKVDNGKGRGSVKVDNKFLNVNFTNSAEVDNGGGRLPTKSG